MPIGTPHLIVVLPGIMGSQLVDAQGKELWGASSGTVITSIVRLGQNFRVLMLPQGVSDQAPGDGVVATAVLDLPHWMTRLFGADGYAGLVDWLKSTFALREGDGGNLLVFPYDWRLSNRYNAAALERRVLPALDLWRAASGNPEARIIFVCHSMGGLIARWFIEKCGGREVTHRLITLGTPYRGSIEALVALSNGLDRKLGPLRFQLTELVRSFPSVYQLLPTYKCMATPRGMENIGALDIPNLNTAMARDAMSFHADLSASAKIAGGPRIHALKGVDQPTSQSARIVNSAIEPSREYEGVDWLGDGTVPRQSSHPPEWTDDSGAGAFNQSHGTLQSDDDIHRQLRHIITADEMPVFAAPEIRLGLDLPELTLAGTPLNFSVSNNFRLALRASVSNEHGVEVSSKLFVDQGGSRYAASFNGLAPGLARVTISSADERQPISKIMAMTMVWDRSAVLA